MTRDTGRRPLRTVGARTTTLTGGGRRSALTPGVEPLEDRQLLSGFFAGATPIRPVQSPGGMYLLTMNGPGLEKVQQVGKGAVAITLFGTTSASTLNVALTRPRPHAAAAPLQIASIRVVSGELGGITAGPATLNGPITPLSGSVNTLQFGGLGPNAQIDVNGALGSLSVGGGVALGPTGHVRVGGDINQSVTVGGTLTLDGGSFLVGRNLVGALNAGGVNLTRGGAFVVGNDVIGPVTVGNNLSVSSGAVLSVGRDVTTDGGGTGGISVNGDLNLDGGKIVVGRNLDVVDVPVPATNTTASLSINGDLTASTGGALIVGGNFNGLAVNGVFQGNGTAVPDLSVGLDLRNVVVSGATPNQGGIQHASIDVGKNLIGLTVNHGIFDSIITAGIAIIDVNIGPDGNDAVINSDIRAGVSIDRFTAGGNVLSTFVANPKSVGYPTRIVAGEDRLGNFFSGGVIDHFQITGTMTDSVLAASVKPFGGSGALPDTNLPYGTAAPVPSNTPGDLGSNTYDAPAGTTTVNGKPFKNWTEVSYVDGVADTKSHYLSAVTDPTTGNPQSVTIDDFIFPGAINPSYASGAVPTKSTVLGGVVSTFHGDEADFAGIFAADTRGVFVGPLP